MRKRSKASRKARAVAGVLGALLAAAAGLRLALDPRTAPPRPAERPSEPAAAPEPPLQWPQEPQYRLLARVDPSLAPAVSGLFSESTATQKAAAQELAGHFVASDTLTGLCPEAPDTLWVLSEAVRLRRSPSSALTLLYKSLAQLANLEDYEKDDFVAAIQDPMAVYVPLGVSHAPHVHESRRMFAHMRRLLEARGKTLAQWIREEDPELRFAPAFLLRLNAYEVLVPYLRGRTDEARAVCAMIFPEKRADAVRTSADQIQNIFDSLASDPRAAGALGAFAEGCLTQLSMASGPVRDQITLFLHLNWRRLPPDVQAAAEFIVGRPRAAAEVPADRRAPSPYRRWPSDRWRFTMHFAEERDLHEWERYFLAKGYRRDAVEEDSITLSRQVPGGPRLAITGQTYASLETGMMFGPALRRFQQALARDLRDPETQGVFIRAHAQFPRAPAFSSGGPASKLWYDGSCRGAWDLAKLQRLCPDCVLIGNVGSGRGYVNNPMIWALLEGLGRKEGWDALLLRIKQTVPEHYSRLIGPWSTPFSQTLKTLKAPPKKI
ncbi:MAG: hypothetical protein HY554_17355 [Elusimicrobia bacterium]|nr:hypothetical protein [Elusimicrobiota bacterium]